MFFAKLHYFKPYFNSIFDILQSPLLLLFLDCVWQLLQQFPTKFEFTETYLTTLWDVSHVSIFDTFLFDCERDRHYATTVSIYICLKIFETQK